MMWRGGDMRWGVEHEFRLWSPGELLDFRRLIAEVPLACFDPGDPRARRLPSGCALTADGREAEIATPPLPISAGPDTVDDILRRERTALVEFGLIHGVDRVTGFSTHLNLSVPDHGVVSVGRRFLPVVPALAAIIEPAASCGVVVRPRRHRLEIGGEYVEGADLQAGLVLAAAAVRGLVAGSLPPGSPPSTVRSREKFGWFVPPEVLDSAGREYLRRLWSWARPYATHPHCVDALLDTMPLRRERGGPVDRVTIGGTPACAGVDPSPRRRGSTTWETVWLTWQYAVWRSSGPHGPQAYAVMRADHEETFLHQLDGGTFDALRPPPRRTLLVNAQLRDLGDGGGVSWWQDLRPGALVPAERDRDGAVPRVSRRRARTDHRLARRARDAVVTPG